MSLMSTRVISPFAIAFSAGRTLYEFSLTVAVCLDVGTDFLGVGEVHISVDALCESGVAYFVVSDCDDFHACERIVLCHFCLGSQGINQPQRAVCFPDFGGKIYINSQCCVSVEFCVFLTLR